MRNITELMKVAPEQHDKNWLIESLQNAVQLELATLPPYLCGMWSVKDSSSDVYALINSIVIEEMLHMALAANMLTSIGGSTVINKKVPTYPGPLPGGVRPKLKVYLGGLTPGDTGNVYKVFMQIEYPEGGPVALMAVDYPTIGFFYTAIEAAFEKLPASDITGDKQIVTKVGSFDIFAIDNLQNAKDAIEIIKEQGEGTSTSPEVPVLPEEPKSRQEFAHYYKFAEIYNGKELIQDSTGKWVYEGDAIPFPETYPMAKVPPGGYPTESAAFDKLYSSMLNYLQEAWEVGGNAGKRKVRSSVTGMYALGSSARTLMQKWIDPNDHSKGTYGPSFLYVS